MGSFEIFGKFAFIFNKVVKIERHKIINQYTEVWYKELFSLSLKETTLWIEKCMREN